jgi:hypothetical protein
VEFANRDEYSNDRFVVTEGNKNSEALRKLIPQK